MKEIYNGETVALGGVNLVTKQVVVDDSTGEKANFTYDKTTGSITVLDEVDPDSVNPVTARAVAQAVAGASGEVPIIGDNDNGKVLKAVVSGGQKSAEWGEAQSGPSYTAGDGIKISNDKVAVRAGKNLDFANELVATQLYSPLYEYHGIWAWSVIGPLNMTRIVQLRQGMTIKMKAGASLAMTGADGGAHFAICRKDSANGPEISGGSIVLVADAALTTDTSHNFLMRAGDTYVADFSTLSEKSVGSFLDIDDDNVGEFYLTVLSYSAYTTVNNSRYITGPILDYPGDLVNTAEYYTENPSVKELVAVDQLPASTSADADKVLTVNSTGKPVWAAAPGGSAITYLNGTESAKDIMDMLDAGAFPVYKETVANDHDNGTNYLYYTVTRTHAYVDDQSMPAYSLTLTCLYPAGDPDQISYPGYTGRIAGYRVVGSTWTKTTVQVL